LHVSTSRGPLTADLAFGGAFYASVAVEQAGLTVEPRHLPALIELGREVKRALEASRDVVHPDEPELRDVYGVIFVQEEGRRPLAQRNVTIFADGEVDRSPCGSGTSAQMVTLRSEEHTSELQSQSNLVCRLLLEKKKKNK